MFITRLFEEGGTEGGVEPMVLIGLAIFLVVFFLMVLLGALVANKGWLKKEEEPAHDAHGHAEAAHVAHKSSPDDLTSLEGIGSKVAKLLAGIGITSFQSLAQADKGKLKAALDAAGYKYMDPNGWIEQAALVVKGDMAGLKKLQDSLRGGRKVS